MSCERFVVIDKYVCSILIYGNKINKN